MTLVPIFRRILIGASEASLDIAGAAFLPGAWPVLKGALGPVLERLKDRLGGEDVTKSYETANEAVEEFESDTHLQEMLRSILLQELQEIIDSHKKIDADVQKLMLVVTGDQKLLRELLGGIDRIEEHLEAGVNLSDEAVEKLTKAVAREADNSRQVRAIALREMGPVAQLVARQVHRLQIRAVELIESKELDRAHDELREGLLLVSALLNEAPTDIGLQLEMGGIYKTIAQIFQEIGNLQQADMYIERAEHIFGLVKDNVPGDQKTALDIANAIHGLGNMYHMRGNLEKAIENYKLTSTLYQNHCYTWHDMFLAYNDLAKQGKVHLDEMRHALDMVKKTGMGQPGLSAKHIAGMDAIYTDLEKRTMP